MIATIAERATRAGAGAPATATAGAGSAGATPPRPPPQPDPLPQPVPPPQPDPSPPPPRRLSTHAGPRDGVCPRRRPGYRIYVLLDFDLRLRPDERSPAEARRSLEALRPSLDDALVDDAVLLVSEIVSNSVRHASLDAGDAIQIRVRGSDSMLHVDVMDPGPGFDPDRLPPSRSERWLGAALARPARDRWGVERNDVTRVWFELAAPVSPDSIVG